MADNFVTNPGSGGATFASDDISSVQHPRVKVEWGADGTAVDTSATNPMPVQLIGMPTSGCTVHRSIDLDEGALEVVKASAGTVYGFVAINRSTAARYIKFSNATSGTVGTTAVYMTFPLEGSQGMAYSIPQGIVFSTGITVGASTGLADNDTGAPAANDVVIQIFFK
jgi:hypothetical protein